MLYLFGFIFSALLVAGQILWKLAVDKGGFELSTSFLFTSKVVSFIFSPYLIGGVFLYLVGTILNMWMLTKYEFSSIQGISIPLVLAMSFAAGWWLFKDDLSVINVVGLLVIVSGIVLATWR